MMERPRALAEPMLLAFTGVAALVLAAAWQWGGAEWLLLVAVPLWLALLAEYDLRHRQVPRLAWVAGPCLLAMGLAAARGDWALAASALVALAASERGRLPASGRRPALVAGWLACFWLMAWISTPSLMGAVALLGFWLMFELGWWAGADALAAMTLVLLWPTAIMVLVIGIAHLIWAFTRRSAWRWPRPLSADELAATGQPGLPALALAAGLHTIFSILSI